MLYDLNDIEAKYDCSSAPRDKWLKRMKNAMEEAGNLLLYAHVCAKSCHDMSAASATEKLLDKCEKAVKRLEG